MGRREVHVDQMELFTPTITNPRKRVDRKTTTAVRYVKAMEQKLDSEAKAKAAAASKPAPSDFDDDIPF